MRRLVFILSLVLTIAFAALAVYSHGRVCTVLRGRTALIRHPTVADGTMGAWSIDVVTLSGSAEGGKLVLRRSLYQSIHDHEPKADEVAAFSKDDGWKYVETSAANAKPDTTDKRYFDTIGNWRFAGLGVYESAGGASTHKTIEAPLWLLAVVSALPGLLIVMRWRKRRRRVRLGLCPYCGYDVSKAMLVCPECGRDVVKR